MSTDWVLVSEGPWSKRRKHQAVVWNDQLLLLGGFDGEAAFDLNDIWSFDGIESWCQITQHAGWSGRDGHCAVVLNGSLFILGGTDDPYNCRCDVWRSEDGGFLWRQICSHAPWPARWQHAACVHDGKMYITGGWGDRYLNDVWCSSDGTKWTQVCSNAPWKPRMFHSAISFNNAIYILGGHDGRAQLKDIWASSDGGKVWTQVCQAAQWEGRQGHTTVALDGHVYLMGGFGGSKRYNDMWKSKDCAHWTLVNNHCNWSPRQGHASIAFRGAIYMLGGFDEHGYSNSTYKYQISDNNSLSVTNNETALSVNNSSSSISESNKRAAKVVTVSMTCALESIEKLKLKRIDREKLIQKLITVVGLVMDAVHNKTNDNSQQTQNITTINNNIDTEKYEKMIESNDERQRSLSDAITSGKKGSPFRENFTDFGTATGRRAIPTITNDEDLRMQFWRMVSTSSEKVMSKENNNETSGEHKESKSSSAALRESMEQDRKNLRSIQSSIRKAAESGSLIEMEQLIIQRTTLAEKANREANLLNQHISNIRKLQDDRSNQLECILSSLEDFFDEIGQVVQSDENNELMQCTWTEWEKIARSCADIVAKLTTNTAEEAITLLHNEFKSEIRITNEISDWMMSNASDLLNSNDDFVQSKLLKYEKLAQEYDDIHDSLDKCRMSVKAAVDSELAQIFIYENETKDIFKIALEKGCALVKSMIAQNSLDVMEIAAMESELIQWSKTVMIISSREELQKECDGYIKEKDEKEDELLKLEDMRIDIRSELEKATLKAQRSSMNSRSKSEETTRQESDEIEKIRDKLSIAEKEVKEMRKNMRSWFRNLRRRAMEYIPELFHYLPDLQAPGSVLGDGGFAENAKLPRRQIEEYDDVEPLVVSDSSSGEKKFNGRHVLLKASYDGEEVVLKGFVVNEDLQRRGLERELSILGRLRNDSIIMPGAVVEDVGNSSRFQVIVYIEYPYYKGGNLQTWLKAEPRKPWELQAIARQLLYGIMYLHDHGVIHKDIKPSNVLLHEDGRVVLADFELSKELKAKDNEEEVSTTSRAGTIGFMSPEVESGGNAVYASDMYSFGVVVYYMHFPTEIADLIPGNPRIPQNNDADLIDLLKRLLAVNASQRPSAASALMHPYFRSTFVERMMQDGEVVEQDRKLDAVRNLLHCARSENRTNLERITVHRDGIVAEVLQYFSEMKLEKLRASLRVTFVGEPGVDEGGLLTEMFTIFFESVLGGEDGLFVGSEAVVDDEGREATTKQATSTVLPNAQQNNDISLIKFRAFGRAMVKSLYEGRRIGSRLCPSVFKYITGTSPNMRDLQMYDPQTARSLQWALATGGVEDFGLHFESVGEPDSGPVTDLNKAKFVRMKIDTILVKSRQAQLLSIKAGFTEALKALSEEAAPFMSLLSHADWRVLLCGESAISGPQVISVLKFAGFPKKSSVPQWLKEILLASSEDHLRKFLVFVTGSPSLSSSSRDEINVRYQSRSGALPVAHTCFFHLDIPDYRDKETLQSKLMYAVNHATTFEVV